MYFFILIISGNSPQGYDNYELDLALGLDCCEKLGEDWLIVFHNFLEKFVSVLDLHESDLIYFYMILCILECYLNNHKNSEKYKLKTLSIYKKNKRFFRCINHEISQNEDLKYLFKDDKNIWQKNIRKFNISLNLV